MIDGAERVDFSAGLGDNAIGAGGFGGVQELGQEGLGDVRHIAGNKNIPIGLGDFKGRVKAAQRSAVFNFVGDKGQSKMRISGGRADEGHISGGTEDAAGNFLDHGFRAEREQGFVATHAPAGSAGQDKPCVSHEMMLAMSANGWLDRVYPIVESNKKVYICSLVALAMLAASPSRAAEVVSTTAAPAPVVHRTQVVRTDPRSGKLVRSVVVSSRPLLGKISAPTQSSKDLNAMVDKSARANNVDPLLVHSIIKVESNYNSNAVSNKGAQGLMQLTPSTARMLGVTDSFNPQQNIEAGVKYLKYLKDLYKDDRLALAAYNAGPGAVDKYGWIPPYAETQNYVYQVGKRYGEARRAADAAAAVKQAEAPVVKVAEKAVEAKPAEPAKVEQFIDENGRLHLKTTQ
jgi:soluble lytic murein transglycosylase-like protein